MHGDSDGCATGEPHGGGPRLASPEHADERDAVPEVCVLAEKHLQYLQATCSSDQGICRNTFNQPLSSQRGHAQ